MSRRPRYCVCYARTIDPRTDRPCGVGDGLTCPSSILMGVYSSLPAARRALRRFRDAPTPAFEPVPEYDTGEYYWTDYVSDQELREIIGDAGTCRIRRREIREGARRRARALLSR